MSSSLDNTPNDPQSTPSNPLLRRSNPLVSDLEQDVLDEYTRLLGNLNKARPAPRSSNLDTRRNSLPSPSHQQS